MDCMFESKLCQTNFANLSDSMDKLKVPDGSQNRPFEAPNLIYDNRNYQRRALLH